MLHDHTKTAPDPDVVTTFLKDAAVLLHLGTQSYYTLNETGSFIWQLLEQGQVLGEIHAALEGCYEVTREQAARCTAGLVSELLKEKLVTVANRQD